MNVAKWFGIPIEDFTLTDITGTYSSVTPIEDCMYNTYVTEAK